GDVQKHATMRAAMDRPRSIRAAVNAVVIGTAVVFVFLQLQPHLLFTNTTAAGGDMGAHVWGPAYLRDHLLPHWRLTGWAPDWYAGYPALTFYFPLPSLIIVVLGLVMPYVVAFKLVSVLGLLTLPVAAWALGRLSGMRDPGPACLAVAPLRSPLGGGFTTTGATFAPPRPGGFAFSATL